MPKPLIVGDATYDEDRIEQSEALKNRWDYSYVEGYSEARRDNELRMRKGQDEIPIDRLQWIRASNVKGENVPPDEMIEWHMKGFAACTKDDLESRGWKMGPQCYVSPDGTIRRGDLMLAICSNEVDKANKARHRHETALMEGNPKHAAVEEVGSKKVRGSIKELLDYAEQHDKE